MTHAEFKRRFLPLQKMLYREAYRMLCDSFEAEDAVQNLYLRLWERKEELKNIVATEAYCRKLLRNICIDRWRVIRTHDDIGEMQADNIVVDSPPDIERREAGECLEKFLAALPEQQRRVMQMRMNGCGFDEIESVTGLSQVNIRVIVSRVRKKFREFYDNQ
ncbi:MAG: sigma-70 family RNA polymerase sigma factor [Bacteroidaceae bacterium]|nr:sigma-70 family RNA polymerase sigma factor [Bacteroidaceae bacterium]